jgi:hypothetical protein
MIDQIFITYYVFTVAVVLGTKVYGKVYKGEKYWVFITAGGTMFIAGISAVVHAVYYIWR